MAAWPRRILTISRWRRCTRKRCSCCCRGLALRTSTIPPWRACSACSRRSLKRDIRHPGACHLYIHTTELTSEPQRAVACAEHLGSAIPGASHINHMPSHTWTRVGRWGDAVQASLQAWQSDQKAAKGEGFATYPAHDLQMLVLAASMDGQGGAGDPGRARHRETHERSDLSRAGAGPLRPVRRSGGDWRSSERTTLPVASGISLRGTRSFDVAMRAARGASSIAC